MKNICRRLFVHLPLLCLIAVFANQAAAARPSVSITNLKAGQKFTNAEFTVEGKASGSVGVSNVLYSLNQGAWNSVTSSNQWTNWSATVTFIPGTNSFSVKAVDNAGSSSATSTVKVFYAVTATMTVVINGNGSASPNYNGAQLDIGKGYSMKAAPGNGTQKGFGFRNWSDGNSNVITTSVNVSFLMASNLTLVANFGYVGKPTITATSTTTNSDGYPADFVIHGTAKDSIGVTNVLFLLNGGTNWQTAITTNNWTNWTANVQLLPNGNTFYAYAVNASNNVSALFVANLIYNSAPASLAGKSAVVTDGNTPLFTVALGKGTFSQVSENTNYANGVGTYTYSPSGSSGLLKFKYTAPPGIANHSQSVQMLFQIPSYAYVSIANAAKTNSGFMYFTAVSNLAPVNVTNQLVWSISSQGDGNGTLYQKTAYTSTGLISGETNSGNYTYTRYSPVGSLFKLTSTNGTTCILANFEATNYGAYSESDYTVAGQTNGTDTGRFILDTQMAGGNAPLTVSNRNLQIFSVGGSFNVQFGADTYSQDSATTNFDNDVGDYTYAQATTNIGQLNLTVTAPPADATNNVLAGSTSAARLIFAAPNLGLFTNDDGTLSSFVLTSVTNVVPTLIASNTLNLIYVSGYFLGIIPQYATNQFQFDTNGNFTFNSTNNTPSGTYVYQPFSPTVAMIQFNFTTNGVTNGTELDWVRLNFGTTNSGNYFTSQFDTETNFIKNISGSFSLH